ncbi:MAG: type II toxin-antitoxin system VapC family toxin [Verrucomicrobiota bacterium]
MSIDYLIDTNFLISVWREKSAGKAWAWLRNHPDQSLGIPWIVKGEFLCGSIYTGQDASVVNDFLDRYPTLWPDERIVQRFASLYAILKKKNALPGPHDLWIASTAIEIETPLLTRNVAQFRRIPGCVIEAYEG